MTGRRIEYSGDGIPADGTYWRDPRDGHWYAVTPNGSLAALALHQVTEHEDGTITVSPSIRTTSGKIETFHGYLEHGVWRSC